MFEQHVAVTWHDGAMWVEKIVSDSPITIDGVAAHYQDAHDFNEDKDSLEFVDAPETVSLDECDDSTDTPDLDNTPTPDGADVCIGSKDCKHQPNWSSTNIQHDSGECYIHVNCIYCGTSGCIGISHILREGINW